MIKEIEGLYPTDCQYSDTNTIGGVILLKAMKNTNFDWRELPLETLNEYLMLCKDEEITGELTQSLRNAGVL